MNDCVASPVTFCTNGFVCAAAAKVDGSAAILLTVLPANLTAALGMFAMFPIAEPAAATPAAARSGILESELSPAADNRIPLVNELTPATGLTPY